MNNPLQYFQRGDEDVERFANPESYNAEQRATWERSFQSDPDWHLVKGYSNHWMYAPKEPSSEQYRQGKEAMLDVIEKVQQHITPSSGEYNPRSVPQRVGGRGGVSDWLERLHFDPLYQPPIMASKGVTNVNPLQYFQQGTDTVPAMLTPHEAVLNPLAADLIGRDTIRNANAMGNRMSRPGYQFGEENVTNPMMYAVGTSDVPYVPITSQNDPRLSDTPPTPPPPISDQEAYKQWIIQRILNGEYDRSYGPTSPGATSADRRQFIGASDNRLKTGNVALPPSDYALFTDEEREKLGIADKSYIKEGQPNQPGIIERYFGTGSLSPTSYAQARTGFEPMPSGAGAAPDPYAQVPAAKPEGFDYKGLGGSLSKIGQQGMADAEALRKEGLSLGMSIMGMGNPYIGSNPWAGFPLMPFGQFGSGG